MNHLEFSSQKITSVRRKIKAPLIYDINPYIYMLISAVSDIILLDYLFSVSKPHWPQVILEDFKPSESTVFKIYRRKWWQNYQSVYKAHIVDFFLKDLSYFSCSRVMLLKIQWFCSWKPKLLEENWNFYSVINVRH